MDHRKFNHWSLSTQQPPSSMYSTSLLFTIWNIM
eukprot:UN03895